MRADQRRVLAAAITLVIAGCSTAPSAPPGPTAGSSSGSSLPAQTPVAFVPVAESFAPLAPPTIDVSAAPARVHVAASGGTSAWIGPDGGSLTARSGDGVTLKLHIPAGAVREPTPMTMTPISSIDALGLRDGLAAGAYLSPAGLELAEPATLTISGAPFPIDGGMLIGFDVEDDGATALIPATSSDRQIALTFFHFSSPGAGFGTSQDLQALAPATASGNVSSVLTSLLTEPTPWNALTMAQAFADISGVWTNQIEDELTTVVGDAALQRALADWRQFVFLLNLYARHGDVVAALGDGSLSIVGPFPVLTDPSPFFTAGQTLAGSRIADAAAGNTRLCTPNHDLNALANVLYWTTLGPRYAPNGIVDWATLRAGCASVDIGTYNPASNLRAGGSDSFRIAFVLRFSDQAQVPGDFQAAFDAGGFTFQQSGGSHLDAAAPSGSLLTVSVEAANDPPYDLSENACWYLGGLSRGLCGQFQRSFGVQPSPTPTSNAPTSTPGAVGGAFTIINPNLPRGEIIVCSNATAEALYPDGSHVTDATWTLTGPGGLSDPQPSWFMHYYANGIGTIVITATSGGHTETLTVPSIKDPDPLPGPAVSC